VLLELEIEDNPAIAADPASEFRIYIRKNRKIFD